MGSCHSYSQLFKQGPGSCVIYLPRWAHTKYRGLGPLKRYADFLQVVSLIQSFIYTSRLNHSRVLFTVDWTVSQCTRLEMLMSRIKQIHFCFKKMLVLGMRNYADTFFVDFMVDHETTFSARAVMTAYFCGLPLRFAVNKEPVWYVSFSSLPKSSPPPHSPVGAALLKCNADLPLLSSYIWILRPFWQTCMLTCTPHK